MVPIGQHFSNRRRLSWLAARKTLPTEVKMRRFGAVIWFWTLSSTAEKAAILLAILFGLGAAAAALNLGYNVGAHIGKPGWICGEGPKGGLTCRPDPKSPSEH
jgi:hypothetical protein